MIDGYNSTDKEFDFEDIQKCASELSGPTSVDDVFSNLVRRRENAIKGGVNCIPLPFERFRSEIPGIEQGQYVVVTALQKTGKTQLANYLYLFHVLDYCYKHQSQCSCHIIYFALEESVQKVIERYMSHLLWKLSNERYTPSELRSTSSDDPVPQAILDLLKSDEYQKRLDFFNKCVEFNTEDTNPTGILRACEAYAKSVGVYKSHKIASKGDFTKQVEVFDSYEQNDPNHYKIVIIDHIGLVDKEQGFRTKDAVDKMSEYFVKYLRNRYNYTCVAIQQQASDTEGLEAIKMKKMLPSTGGLGDSKYTGRDADLVLGLFDPSKFGLPNWLGYKIQDAGNDGLRNYGRFMYVLANRNGEMGGVCPLLFDGAVCDFKELPKPDSIAEITKIYEQVKDMKSNKQKKKIQSLLFLILNGRGEDSVTDYQD